MFQITFRSEALVRIEGRREEPRAAADARQLLPSSRNLQWQSQAEEAFDCLPQERRRPSLRTLGGEHTSLGSVTYRLHLREKPTVIPSYRQVTDQRLPVGCREYRQVDGN